MCLNKYRKKERSSCNPISYESLDRSVYSFFYPITPFSRDDFVVTDLLSARLYIFSTVIAYQRSAQTG